MPQTKQPFYRLEIIHGLIRARRYGKRKMLERLNDILETQGHSTISSRTLNNDLNELVRLDAKIRRPQKEGDVYQYEEDFWLTGVELDPDHLMALEQAIQILRKAGLREIENDLRAILKDNRDTRLHDEYYSLPDYISFEDHTRASGWEYLPDLTTAIIDHTVLNIKYKSFVHETGVIVFHPYYLKEYRNRWYVFGWNEEKNMINTLALDRIQSVRVNTDELVYKLSAGRFDPETYFRNIIGVTRFSDAEPVRILLYVSPKTAPYIKTKKIHDNMEIIKEDPDGSIVVSLEVEINYELLSTLHGFQDGIKIIEPMHLRVQFIEMLERMINIYIYMTHK